MILIYVVFIALINIEAIFTENKTANLNTLENQWQFFKSSFQKSYSVLREENRRRLIWESNINMIKRHNRDASKGRHTYFLEMNKYGDLTHREFVKKMNGLKTNRVLDLDVFSKNILSDFSARMITSGPKKDTVDWRTKGFVTPVKDQGQCGSCWAFSAVAALEGQIFRKYGQLVDLSEQNLVDCSKNEGNAGCNGGYMDSAYNYIKNNGGIDTTQIYPYEGKNKKCRFKSQGVGANLTSFVRITQNSEEALMNAIENVGPISVAIDAGRPSFQFYSSGIYHEPRCSAVLLDHAVTAVGFGSLGDGLDYYIVKNSWGTTWGQDGYVLMARNKNNNCGIASEAIYPIV